jgi:Tfp pilus assembly protein PilF
VPVRPPHVRPSLLTLFVCTLLFAGTVFLFSRSLDYGFLNYDDPSYLTNNPYVQAGLTWPGLVWAFTGATDYWHPLTWLSHMLDWELYDEIPFGHHLTSILWHALNAVLVFLVFRRLTAAFWAAAFAAALFAWHPLRVESVTWVTERKDVMSGCFFLLTLWTYAAYADRRRIVGHARRLYALTLALFLLGLMSKPMVVSLPLVLLLLDVWPLQRLPAASPSPSPFRSLLARWFPLLREKLPFFALSAAISVVTILMQTSHGAFTLTLPLDARLANAVVSCVRYLGKFLWPAELAVFYPHPGSWPLLVVAAALVLLATVTWFAWRQRTRRPWLLAGWLWFIVVLLPVLGIIQVGLQAMADRYTYLALLGIQLALIWSLRDFTVRPAIRTLAAAAACLALTVCVVRTWHQQHTWRDSVSLFRHAIQVSDNNDGAHGFLAYTLLGLNQFDEAESEARRSLALNPDNTTALFTLAAVHDYRNQLDDALARFQQVLDLRPHDSLARFRLGLTLLKQNKLADAIPPLATAASQDASYREAYLRQGFADVHSGRPAAAMVFFQAILAATPDHPDAHFGLALAFGKLGRDADAFTHLRRSAELRPDFAPVQIEVGLALLARRAPADAVTHFRHALAASPDFPMAHLGLGRALEQLGDFNAAVPHLEKALALDPDNAAIQRAWAVSLARRGRFADAVIHYQRALANLPDDASLHAELGFALLLDKRRDAAIAQFEHALRLDPHFPGLRERLQQLRR